MASMRAVERHLEGGDWTSGIRECGCLLEAILLEIYNLTEPNLSSGAKTSVRVTESNRGKKIQKFTLGELTRAFKDAGVLIQAQTNFNRPLPYLLGADWKTLVNLRNKSIHSSSLPPTKADAGFFAAYVSVFLEELGWEHFGNDSIAASMAIHPFDLFKDFDILEKVIKSRRYDRSDQQGAVGNILLHSIQPAYYLDKLEVLQDYARRLGKNPDFKPMATVLVDARTIVEGACSIYRGLKREEGRGYFETQKINLEVPLTAELDEKQGSWPEAIRLDFLGVCLYHLYLNARKNGQSADATTFLQNAKLAFESALDHFDRLAVLPMLDVAALWKGYVLRNLGSVLAGSGEPELAVKSYRKALKEREQVYQRLRHDCSQLIGSQLLVEVELVKIDIASLEGKSDPLAESATRLLHMRQDLPSVWPHVEEHLYESAIALNAPFVAENVVLAAVEDRLSRLTGKRCAQLICEELRSGKKIHEVVVSRYQARQLKEASDLVPDGESDIGQANP